MAFGPLSPTDTAILMVSAEQIVLANSRNTDAKRKAAKVSSFIGPPRWMPAKRKLQFCGEVQDVPEEWALRPEGQGVDSVNVRSPYRERVPNPEKSTPLQVCDNR